MSPERHFHDTRYEDFLASAVAIGPALSARRSDPLGTTIRRAVEATLRWTRSNTNLGIVLLLAPLARAALQERGSLRERLEPGAGGDHGRRRGGGLRRHPAGPAREGWEQARRGGRRRTARPSRCGKPWRSRPSETAVAREYVTDFALTFEIGVPAHARRASAERDSTWTDAAVETYLALLESGPDTHIARKLGIAEAEIVSGRAASGAGGGRHPVGGRPRRPRCAGSPSCATRGTAGIRAPPRISPAPRFFVVILEGGWDR